MALQLGGHQASKNLSAKESQPFKEQCPARDSHVAPHQRFITLGSREGWLEYISPNSYCLCLKVKGSYTFAHVRDDCLQRNYPQSSNPNIKSAVEELSMPITRPSIASPLRRLCHLECFIQPLKPLKQDLARTGMLFPYRHRDHTWSLVPPSVVFGSESEELHPSVRLSMVRMPEGIFNVGG